MQRQRTLLSLLAASGLAWWLLRTAPGQGVVTAVKSAILPRGLRNNNPGNLRVIARSPWLGQVGGDAQGYGVYESMERGARAAAKQLLKYERSGLNTVRKIIATWAPASENDTASYVAQVAKALKVPADQPISVNTHLEALAWAIFKHENGFISFSRADSDRWVRLP